MKKKYAIYSIISVTCIALIIGGFYVAFYNGYIRMNYPSLKDFPIQGIDISHHQGKINWDKIDKELVSFAFIKATEGGDHKDTLFAYNREQAKGLNIAVGAYHFFTFCKSGEEQARNFIESVPNDSTSLSPVIDLEFGGNCKQSKTDEEILFEIAQFIKIAEDYYKKKVIIYSTNEFYSTYLMNAFPENPIWIRDILKEPKLLKDGRQWLFWQYTNRAKIDGIETYVDLNAFGGSREEFMELLR